MTTATAYPPLPHRYRWQPLASLSLRGAWHNLYLLLNGAALNDMGRPRLVRLSWDARRRLVLLAPCGWCADENVRLVADNNGSGAVCLSAFAARHELPRIPGRLRRFEQDGPGVWAVGPLPEEGELLPRWGTGSWKR